LVVSFTNTSGGDTDWLWDFGDGATSTQQNPDHTYLEAKDYVVRLTVSGPGGTDFVEHTVTVSAT
jgi:PKD repeat protein